MKYLGNPASGSQAQTTASHNAFGQYTRNRRKPVNPNTTHQSAVRAILSTLAKIWKILTDAQRIGWKSLAGQLPRTDSLGQTVNLSGFQQFISTNSKRENFGDAYEADAPASPPTVDALTLGTITRATTHLNIPFTSGGTLAGQRIGVYASPQVSAGVSFTNDLRLIEVTGLAPASPLDIGANYSARFGSLTTGNRVFVSLETYNAGFTNPGVVGSIVL